jgi:hypothetical protein
MGLCRGAWGRAVFGVNALREGYGQGEWVASIIICGETLLHEEPGYYNSYSLRNVRIGREFTDLLTVNVLEPGKLPVEPDGSRLFNWGQFFKVRSREELSNEAIKQEIEELRRKLREAGIGS